MDRSAARNPGLATVEHQLRSLRFRAAALLLFLGLTTVLGLALGGSILWGTLDYLVRLPAWLRLIGLGAGVFGLVWSFRRWVFPAIRFRPGLTELALRLERSDPGRAAGLSGLLASGLELSAGPSSGPVTDHLASRVVAEAAVRAGSMKAGSLLNPRAFHKGLFTVGAAVGVMALLVAAAGPKLVAIGAARVYAPWSGAQWPKRTQVADATGVPVHALGEALPLRAAILTTDQSFGQTRVAARYRILDGSPNPPVQRSLMTSQQRTIPVGEEATGELYERLIEPAALAGRAGSERELEYWFETGDDRTEPVRVKLVQPPAVVGASVQVVLPDYAAGGTAFVSGTLDLGPGNDQRAVVGPLLAGSKVKVEVALNKPVRVSDEASGAERRAWLKVLVGGIDLPESFDGSFDGAMWTFAWTADSSVRLPIMPVDDYGLKPADEAAFAFDVAADRPPTATVTEPREDEAVLATAIVPVTGEGRDDVGLASVQLDAQRATAAPGSIGASPEPAGERLELAAERNLAAGSALQASVRASVDLAMFKVRPGDEVWVTTLAADTYAIGAERHDPVRSAPRKLRIITEEDLVEQVRAELSAVRRLAMKLDEEQGELRTPVQAGAITPDDRRRQSGLAQRIQQQAQTIERLTARTERNRLNDEALTGLLSDIGELLDGAARDAEQAGERMDAAAAKVPGEDQTPLTPEEAEAIGTPQEAVRDQLGQVAQTLDQGEDSWLVGRNLQRLIQQQRELMSRTAQAGERTMGKRAEDLTPQERAELRQIADQQRRLSDAAREAIDQLAQRGRQMEKVDAAESQGMKQAAETGRQEQVPETMSQAAQAAEQNQTSTAEQQQQQAMESLEKMSEQIQQARKNRDEALRRTLADLVQSLETLIREQDAQITALAAAVPRASFTGLDAALFALNRNTLDVAEKARADRQTAPMGELVDKAAGHQGRAIGHLRAVPVVDAEADKSERESLRLLKLAHAEAKKQHDEAAQREEDRKREELRKAYRERLEQQVALKGDTDPYIGKPIDRRDRMRVRGLGDRQDILRASLKSLKDQTKELADAGVFDLAHGRLETAGTAAATGLREGRADRAVERGQESLITLLRALVQALEDAAQQSDEFRDDEGGDGGEGSSGQSGQQRPLIPPLAELRLLRAMQQEAADLTRSLDETRSAASEADLAGLADLQKSLSEQAEALVQKVSQRPPSPPEGKP
jgi:hypothetical protein